MIYTTVTLNALSKAQLQQLLNGTVVGAALTQPQVQPNCAQLIIQWDPGNGAKQVFVGDGGLSTVNRGFVLNAANPTFSLGEGGRNVIGLPTIWVMPDSDSTKFNVTVLYA